MQIDRRHFFALTAAAAASTAASPIMAAPAAPISALGLDAGQFGLRPGSPDDQSRALQRAVDEAARARAPLAIAPGTYRVGGVKLAAGTQLIGARGATRLVYTEGPSLLAAAGADRVTLSGLVLDGGRRPLPERRGLVQLENCAAIKIADCEIASSGGNGLVLAASGGDVSTTTFTSIADVAIHSFDARGLTIARNVINGAGNNGIQVWRSQNGDDGSIVVDNRIENVDNRAGGSGQYGNAVNVFRAGNVIVRGNRIRNCAFSAVRGNAASNITIEGNSVSDMREVALYSEFGFEGAVIHLPLDRAVEDVEHTLAFLQIPGAALGAGNRNHAMDRKMLCACGRGVHNGLNPRALGAVPGGGYRRGSRRFRWSRLRLRMRRVV